MNVVLQSPKRTLLSVSPDELLGICNAFNEVCHDSDLQDPEFQTRLGVTREFVAALLAQMPTEVEPSRGLAERADLWAEQGAVHVVCISAFGDPVELNVDEARSFATRLQAAIAEAE